MVSENPLIDIAQDPSRLLVAFLMDPEDLERLDPLTDQDQDPESLALGSSHAVYLWCSEGVIKSRLREAVVSALDKAVTARNWKTVVKIEATLET